MRRIFAALVGILAMFMAAPAVATATLTTNGSGQLTGVTGLTVGSSTYNVTFADGTCPALFSGCDAVTDFTFQNGTDATSAAAALIAAIVGSSFDTAPGTTFGCIGGESCDMLIPYGIPAAGSFDARGALNLAGSNSTGITLTGNTALFDTSANNSQVFALFSIAAVPEPSTWAMMLLGFAAMGLAMRRRGRLAAA